MLDLGPLRPVVWLHGCITTPPFSPAARRVTGYLLYRLQRGERLGMPHGRPMPSIGPGCLELRISDAQASWRVICRLDPDAVLVLDVFAKMTRKTPLHVVRTCRQRLARHDAQAKEEGRED